MTIPTPEPNVMLEEATVAAALRSAGKTITVNPATYDDRTSVQLRYTFLSLYNIEDEYGSIGALLERVRSIDGERSEAMNGPMLTIVLDLVRFGWTDADGESPDVPPDRKATARRLSFEHIGPTISAAVKAIGEAFGPEAPKDPEDRASRPDPTQASSGSPSGRSPLGIPSPAASGA